MKKVEGKKIKNIKKDVYPIKERGICRLQGRTKVEEIE